MEDDEQEYKSRSQIKREFQELKDLAREMIESIEGDVAGFYLMPPFGRVEVALELLRVIRDAHA